MGGKKIIFHDNNLTLRGTSIAVFNYADYNEKILGGKSIVMAKPDDVLNRAKDKFLNRFETYFGWWNSENLDRFMDEHKVDAFYSIRQGLSTDGPLPTNHRSLVHAVFRHNDPHGTRYAYVSDWLAKDQGYSPETHSVPHIVEKLPTPLYDLRDRLGIPKDKVVFGCYGGATEFNIPFVHHTINKIAQERSDIVFLFMNINKFVENNNTNNIIHIQGTYDLFEKSAFVNACDAMIHARQHGETFGLACSEFALENKPVITFNGSSERSHIDILAERGIYYNDPDELYYILNNLPEFKKYTDYYVPYQIFSPEKIMDKFNNIFLL